VKKSPGQLSRTNAIQRNMDIRDSYIQAIRDQENKKDQREDKLALILDRLIDNTSDNELKKIEENGMKISVFQNRIKELEGKNVEFEKRI